MDCVLALVFCGLLLIFNVIRLVLRTRSKSDSNGLCMVGIIVSAGCFASRFGVQSGGSLLFEVPVVGVVGRKIEFVAASGFVTGTNAENAVDAANDGACVNSVFAVDECLCVLLLVLPKLSCILCVV